jgi:hypothetical protein
MRSESFDEAVQVDHAMRFLVTSLSANNVTKDVLIEINFHSILPLIRELIRLG